MEDDRLRDSGKGCEECLRGRVFAMHWDEYLPCKHKDSSLDLQNPYRSWVDVVSIYNVNTIYK